MAREFFIFELPLLLFPPTYFPYPNNELTALARPSFPFLISSVASAAAPNFRFVFVFFYLFLTV